MRRVAHVLGGDVRLLAVDLVDEVFEDGGVGRHPDPRPHQHHRLELEPGRQAFSP